MDTEKSVHQRTTVSQSQARAILREKLNYLETMHPDEIANYFKGYGVKGKRFEATSCPIANWLRSEVEWVNTAFLSQVQSSIYPKGGLAEGALKDSAVSMIDYTNVKHFMHNFDHLRYQELIDS